MLLTNKCVELLSYFLRSVENDRYDLSFFTFSLFRKKWNYTHEEIKYRNWPLFLTNSLIALIVEQ